MTTGDIQYLTEALAVDLAEMLSLPVGQLNSLLTGMQFSGIIKPLSGRLYALDTLNTVLVDNSSANEGLEDDLHG